MSKVTSCSERPGGITVTTSWDDGHVLDYRIGRLLEAYDLAGTFYVAPESAQLRPAERLGERGLRFLAEQFEIGGHTLSHRRLTELSPVEARHEVVAGKAALEKIVSEPLTSFAYPWGAFRPSDVEAVGAAGFRIGRTVRRFCITAPRAPLECGTTVHAYRHLVDTARLAADDEISYRDRVRFMTDWSALAIHLFDRVLETGDVFHLWGHSWEIDRFGDWDRLERVLEYIARRPGVRYVTNACLAADPS